MKPNYKQEELKLRNSLELVIKKSTNALNKERSLFDRITLNNKYKLKELLYCFPRLSIFEGILADYSNNGKIISVGYKVEKSNLFFSWPTEETISEIILCNNKQKYGVDISFLKKNGLLIYSKDNKFIEEVYNQYQDSELKKVLKNYEMRIKLQKVNSFEEVPLLLKNKHINLNV